MLEDGPYAARRHIIRLDPVCAQQAVQNGRVRKMSTTIPENAYEKEEAREHAEHKEHDRYIYEENMEHLRDEFTDHDTQASSYERKAKIEHEEKADRRRDHEAQAELDKEVNNDIRERESER